MIFERNKMIIKEYKTFGKCAFISNDSFDMIVTVEKAFRIICISYKKMDNVMFVDEKKTCGWKPTDLNQKELWYGLGGIRM
jgi:hypothetical protein